MSNSDDQIKAFRKDWEDNYAPKMALGIKRKAHDENMCFDCGCEYDTDYVKWLEESFSELARESMKLAEAVKGLV